MADTAHRGYLISIKNNGENGSRVPITVDSCYIGANADCEVRLANADCEDRHCLIKFLPNKHAIVFCLCNDKPVLLNDECINENGSPLKNGDIIQITDTKFKWEENEAFIDTDNGRFSLNIDNNLAEEVECKRFSEPAHIMNRKNLFEAIEEDEPQFNQNINANEKKDETKVTSETTPLTKSSIGSPIKKTAFSSCGNNRSYNHDSHNQSENNSSRDGSQIRRSRQFCQTYKTKTIANTPDKKKTTPTGKPFFKNTPLQENNRTLGREVKSRFFASRNSSMKPATPSSFVETSEKITVLQNENSISDHVGNVDNLETEVENIVPTDDAVVEMKENTFGNETNAEDGTFETTVPSDTIDARSGSATPRCFTKAFHSTPKAPDSSESELALNLEASETTNLSDALYGPDDPTKICSLDGNSILASPVKCAADNVFGKKKLELDASRMEADSLCETRRHHTRSTSNILKKTFEECGDDNPPVGQKSLTTPEKSTNECTTRNSVLIEESELDGYSPEKKVDSRKSTSELSAETGDAVSSLEVRDKSQKHDDSSMMAKCSRNLSSFSPPENNRSQEYMDSVVSTPKKQCFDEVSLSAVTTPAKDSIVGAVTTPKTPDSPRHRRSTGMMPFVGTPSDVYRTNKGGFTPAQRSRFNRTSMEVEVSVGPRDSLSYSAPSRLAPKRSSSERKSTPLKSDKSVARDSLQMHSPIVEEYDLENEESQNESPNNDSQFQFVSKRRRRLAKSSFAIEERILEESEIISSDLSNEDEVIDEESLEPMESFDDNSGFGSTRIVVSRTAGNETENGLDSTYNLDSLDEDDGSKLELTSIKPNLPKSILTPLPRHALTAGRDKSTKKVTFCNLKEDSLNVTVCSMANLDSEYDSHQSSRVNSSADVSSGVENVSLPKDSEDEGLYLSDKSSDAYSFNSSAERSDSIVQQILAKRNKSVKRLSDASKGKSPRLSGVRRLMNPPKSPKCDYMNVSGVKQLMKTPESLIKPVKKPSLKSIKTPETKSAKTPETKSTKTPETKSTKTPETTNLKTPETACLKTPEPLNVTSKTPESRAKSSKAIANRQKTPASFGKRAKTPEALAECLNTPKALMELAKPPIIVVDFVETPLKENTSDSLLNKEVGKSTPLARKSLLTGNGDSTFATPTMRRCSKHFRIHRNSLCMLASSVNSTLNETLSPHDCSASLENSVIEQTAENEMPPPPNPEEAYKSVMIELKEKLRMLKEIRDDVDKEELENSIIMIDKALSDELAPDDTSVVEQELHNTLLNLKKRYSYPEKSNEITESAVVTDVFEPVVHDFDDKEQSITNQSRGESEVAAASKVSEDSFIDTTVASSSEDVPILPDNLEKSTEISSSVADSATDEASNNISPEKNSEEVQNSVSDAVEEILSNVCGEAKTDEVSDNILSVSSADVSPSNISVVIHSDKDVSHTPDFEKMVNDASGVVDSLDTTTCISNETSFAKVNSENSLCRASESEATLNATDDFSKSVDVYHSTAESEDSALVEKEATPEALDEEPQVDASISEPIETQLTQSISSSRSTEEKAEPQPDTSVSNMSVRHLPKHVETEEPETDSENLELFVSDSDEVVSSEPKSTTREKFNSEETISDVAEVTIGADENTAESTTNSVLVTSAIESLPANCVEEIRSKKSFIPASDSTVEKIHQKSGLDNSSNDTFKTCSPISNLTMTTAEVEEGEKSAKILDTIVAHEKSKRLLDVSASLLVHEENKENLLSLTPIPAGPKEKEIIQMESTPAPASLECSVTENMLLTVVADTPLAARSLDSSVSAESNADETIDRSEKSTPAKLSSADVSISLNSSYPTDVELDTTCEENLSCIEPSMAGTGAETSTNGQESRMTVTSCVAEERITDASSRTLNSSQTSTDSSDMPATSEASTTQPSEVSSSVSESAAVAPVEVPESNAQIMVTPRKCTAVCVSIESQDQLTLAGPKIVTLTANSSAKSLSTSTPLFSDVTKKAMEIPPSCSTTIDPAVSSSEDEAAELSTESSETIIDDEKEHPTVDSSAYADVESQGETTVETVQNELVSDRSADSQPAETTCDDTRATEVESQIDSASVSQDAVSAAVSQESVLENGVDIESEVEADNDEVTAPADSSEETEVPAIRLSRKLSVVLQDAKADIPPAMTDSISQEVVPKIVIAEKSVADNEVESTRPKRGRSTRRYTESKGESSTQSTKRTRNTAKAAASNVMNVSVDLERIEVPQEEKPAKANQRKTVHFNIEPAAKRPTKPRDLGKLYVPTPKRRRTGSLTEDSDASPVAESTVDQFGSPCSIILKKMSSSDKTAPTTNKTAPKRAPRSRSVAPKESARMRPARAASLESSSERVVVAPKRKTRAKKVDQALPDKDSAKEESQLDVAVAPKPKDTSKASKSVAKNKKKTEISEPPKEEKQSKRKAADEVADAAGSSTSVSKGKKTESSKAVEVPAEGERKTRRKAAEVVETKPKKETTKSKKNASQSKDEVASAKSQNEMPAKEEKRSKRKVEDAQEDKKIENPKAKRAAKGAAKNEVSETVDDSNSSSRATRQRKTAVEATEPPKTGKRAKVDVSTETATTSRATRSRKDAETEASEKSGKSTKSKATVASETSKSRATKRNASVVDVTDEVVSKRRKQSPDPVPVAPRATRSKKNDVTAVVSSGFRINLKKTRLDDKENNPSVRTKTANDEKPVASAASKKMKDSTPAGNTRVTRAAKVKEAPQNESSIVAAASSTTRVTRSRNVSTLPASRRAKK